MTSGAVRAVWAPPRWAAACGRAGTRRRAARGEPDRPLQWGGPAEHAGDRRFWPRCRRQPRGRGGGLSERADGEASPAARRTTGAGFRAESG
jgi:hypothetical protein